MPHYSYTRTFSYSANQLFDLVADIERYPEFLPMWLDARIRQRHGDTLYVDQSIGFRFLRWQFSTTAKTDQNRQLSITSTDDPFRRLEIIWRFDPLYEGGCFLRLEVEYEFRSAKVGRLFGGLFEVAMRQYVAALEYRLTDLYGPPATP